MLSFGTLIAYFLQAEPESIGYFTVLGGFVCCERCWKLSWQASRRRVAHGSEYKLQTGLHRPVARGIGHDAK
jgi:hypothetical protein